MGAATTIISVQWSSRKMVSSTQVMNLVVAFLSRKVIENGHIKLRILMLATEEADSHRLCLNGLELSSRGRLKQRCMRLYHVFGAQAARQNCFRAWAFVVSGTTRLRYLTWKLRIIFWQLIYKQTVDAPALPRPVLLPSPFRYRQPGRYTCGNQSVADSAKACENQSSQPCRSEY